MRVAHVNDIAFVGSALVAALRPLGVDARLVEPRRPGAGWSYPWKALTLPFRVTALGATAVRLRAARDDLVHVHYARMGLLGPLSGRRFVLHCHGTDVRQVAPRSAWGLLVGPAMRSAAHVYYSTPDLAGDVRRFRPDATFLPNPTSLPPAAATEPSSDVLIGVRLDAGKGLDSIVAVARAISLRRPTTTFTVIAQGPGVDQVAQALGSAAAIISPVAHAEMPGLFQGHRLAIGQMRVGSLGNYELEALAAGIPVAASFRYPGAYPELPPLVPGDDPLTLAASAIELLDDEASRHSLGEAGRRWVATYHGPAAVAARVLDDYRRVLGLDGRSES